MPLTVKLILVTKITQGLSPKQTVRKMSNIVKNDQDWNFEPSAQGNQSTHLCCKQQQRDKMLLPKRFHGELSKTCLDILEKACKSRISCLPSLK